MSLSLFTVPAPVLREKCSPVLSFGADLTKLAKEMLELMYESQGIGLAASQVGITRQICVVDVTEDRSLQHVLINPKITRSEGIVKSEEGCLSMPGFRSTIDRAENITVEYHDLKGNHQVFDADDILSRCIQHEVDHLNGILFADHLRGVKKKLFESWLKKQ